VSGRRAGGERWRTCGKRRLRTYARLEGARLLELGAAAEHVERDAPLLPVEALLLPGKPALPLAPLVKRQLHLPALARAAVGPRLDVRDAGLHLLVHRVVAAVRLRGGRRVSGVSGGRWRWRGAVAW
jgi:hypothetical protein